MPGKSSLNLSHGHTRTKVYRAQPARLHILMTSWRHASGMESLSQRRGDAGLWVAVDGWGRGDEDAGGADGGAEGLGPLAGADHVGERVVDEGA